jgi:hypothetical protein
VDEQIHVPLPPCGQQCQGLIRLQNTQPQYQEDIVRMTSSAALMSRWGLVSAVNGKRKAGIRYRLPIRCAWAKYK